MTPAAPPGTCRDGADFNASAPFRPGAGGDHVTPQECIRRGMGNDRVGEPAAVVEGQREGQPGERRPLPIRAMHDAEGERRGEE